MTVEKNQAFEDIYIYFKHGESCSFSGICKSEDHDFLLVSAAAMSQLGNMVVHP